MQLLRLQVLSGEAGGKTNLNWDAPTTCPQVADGYHQQRGEWRHHHWDDIKEYTELDLWTTCYSWRECIIEVIPPKINKYLEKN